MIGCGINIGERMVGYGINVGDPVIGCFIVEEVYDWLWY